ncbi:MAG TPA: ABC transporter ATP-binding protein [Candidatus Acidoferrales bacterium]|nr:ABC transporter ATP-binding protein [Candidatus Acidoferrales bacterium]
MPSMDELLKLENLELAYGQVQVVWGISLVVPQGCVACLIGPNGAGKTTTLNAVIGVLPVKSGRIFLQGRDVTRERPHRRVSHRLALIPEGRQLWPRMTVEENLMLGAFPSEFRRKSAESLERVYAMFPRLRERRHQAAGTLSGGEQQMCAIGRGLMTDPVLLLLDEPSLGLAPQLVDEVFALIRKIAQQGVTILLAAQNANYALAVSQYGYVMESGHIAMEGPSEKLRADDHVREAYLGASESAG